MAEFYRKTTGPVVPVEGSKYQFYVPEGDWRVHIDRGGEPWIVGLEVGSKAVHALMSELAQAREELATVLADNVLLAESFREANETINELEEELRTCGDLLDLPF